MMRDCDGGCGIPQLVVHSMGASVSSMESRVAWGVRAGVTVMMMDCSVNLQTLLPTNVYGLTRVCIMCVDVEQIVGLAAE